MSELVKDLTFLLWRHAVVEARHHGFVGRGHEGEAFREVESIFESFWDVVKESCHGGGGFEGELV